MKVTVNIRDHLVDQWGPEISIPATIDIDEILEFTGIDEEHEFDIDIHEVLAANRVIAHLWGTEDVQAVRPDLDDDQAWQVLQTVARRLDSQHGMSWETVEIVAEELFGEAPETDEAEEGQP
jgi:hypothetical protein